MIIIADNRGRFNNRPTLGIVQVTEAGALQAEVDRGSPQFVFIHLGWPNRESTVRELRNRDCPVLRFSGAGGDVYLDELQLRLEDCAERVRGLHEGGCTREECERAVRDFVRGSAPLQRELAGRLRTTLQLLVGLRLACGDPEHGGGDDVERLRQLEANAVLVSPGGQFAAALAGECALQRMIAYNTLWEVIRLLGDDRAATELPDALNRAIEALESLVERLDECAREA